MQDDQAGTLRELTQAEFTPVLVAFSGCPEMNNKK